MKKLLSILIVFISCKEIKKTAPKHKTISGLYNLIEPKRELKNIYIFGNDEFYHISGSNSVNVDYSTFKYYIEDNKIYSCLKGVMECNNESKYDLHYTIKSIDTLFNEQIVVFKEGYKLSKIID
ncbi:hypothetical protein [Polaribacter sp. R77954]|uniref:hypothetical protein n=1 Tax=Polaribacter sp. R77954 TaxID=3093870 RepID=UPI0037CB0D89